MSRYRCCCLSYDYPLSATCIAVESGRPHPTTSLLGSPSQPPACRPFQQDIVRPLLYSALLLLISVLSWEETSTSMARGHMASISRAREGCYGAISWGPFCLAVWTLEQSINVILEWLLTSAGRSVLEIGLSKRFHIPPDHSGLNGSAGDSHRALSLLRPPQSNRGAVVRET